MEIARCLGIGVDCLLKEVADNVGGALKSNNAEDNEGVVRVHCGCCCMSGLSNFVSFVRKVMSFVS
jgi:hypothetical protein